MTRLLIEGGQPLKGEIDLPGSVSAAISGLSAGLLADELLVLDGVPKTSETLGLLELLEFLGLRPIIDWEKRIVSIEPSEIKLKALTPELTQRTRFYPLILGALLARFGEAVIPLPDYFRFPPIDRLLSALATLGVEIKEKNGFVFAKGKIRGGSVSFFRNTVMGTLALILSSVLGSSEVRLENAAEEPEVDFLVGALNEMGADIRREAPRILAIKGVSSLRGGLLKIPKDRDLAVFLAVLAIAGQNDILVRGVERSDLTAFLGKLEAIGGSFQVTVDGVRFWREKNQPLSSIEVETRPHPGFMSNWAPAFTLLLSHSDGVSVLHETIFPKRFSYLPFLRDFGLEYQIFQPEALDHAEFYNFDPEDDNKDCQHAVKIFGPTVLKPASFSREADDLESNLPILGAALIAKGQSEIVGDQLTQGYEELAGSLKKVGARVEVV